MGDCQRKWPEATFDSTYRSRDLRRKLPVGWWCVSTLNLRDRLLAAAAPVIGSIEALTSISPMGVEASKKRLLIVSGRFERNLKDCPFVPRTGETSPHVVGRANEQEISRGLLGRLQEGRSTGTDLILYGSGGNRTTVVPTWIEEEAKFLGSKRLV